MNPIKSFSNRMVGLSLCGALGKPRSVCLDPEIVDYLTEVRASVSTLTTDGDSRHRLEAVATIRRYSRKYLRYSRQLQRYLDGKVESLNRRLFDYIEGWSRQQVQQSADDWLYVGRRLASFANWYEALETGGPSKFGILFLDPGKDDEILSFN